MFSRKMRGTTVPNCYLSMDEISFSKFLVFETRGAHVATKSEQRLFKDGYPDMNMAQYENHHGALGGSSHGRISH